MLLRAITFDALYTLVRPRIPIAEAYAEAFKPYFGHLEPSDVKTSFKTGGRRVLVALQVQAQKPLYGDDPDPEGSAWWAEVVLRTARGVGVEYKQAERAIPQLLPALMRRFSSDEGYELFDDVLPTLSELNARGIKMAVVSNADSRMRSVLQSLKVTNHIPLSRIVLSSDPDVRTDKPDPLIFQYALRRMSVDADHATETAHVGDSFESDYLGAKRAGMRAFLLRREGEDFEGDETAHKEGKITVLSSLSQILDLQ